MENDTDLQLLYVISHSMYSIDKILSRKNSSLVQYTNCVSTSFSKPSLDFLTAHVSLNQRLAWERMPIILFYVTLGIGKHTCVFVYYRFSFENFRIIPKWYSNSLLIFIELACILIVVQLLYNKNNSKIF